MTFVNNSGSYSVGFIIDNYYTRNSSEDNTVITVYKPQGDFITGGGYIFPDASAGSYASTDGLKTNFGFNVKYNKKGKKLLGHMNVIFRRDEGGVIHTYQIKGNAIQSLGVNVFDPANLFAEFITKANLTDITDPLFPVSLGGNLSLKAEMTDRGEPGTDDSISFNLIDADGILLYSSNWTGIATAEMMLSGGNLVVHSGFSIETAAIVDNSQDFDGLFEIEMDENPFDFTAKLSLKSDNSIATVKYSVYDGNNKLIFTNILQPSQDFVFGKGLKSGMYLVIVSQGDRVGQIRMIKK